MFHFQFVITKSNKLYTWGASPQLIRLMNQSRKRARMAQKFEDTKTAMSTENPIDKSTEPPETNSLDENGLKDQVESAEEPLNQETNSSDANSTNTGNVELFEQNENVPKSLASKLNPSNLQDRIRNFLRSESKQSTEKSGEFDAAAKINSEYYLDDEYTDHFLPQQVETSDVVGDIIQVTWYFEFFFYF